MIRDVSVTVRPGIVTYPGEPGPTFTPIHAMASGDLDNVNALSMGIHTGTHVDAPRHFIADGATADSLDLEAMVGPCRVVEVPGDDAIGAPFLENLGLPPDTRRVLFKTTNILRAQKPVFDPTFVALGIDGARWVTANGIRLVGIDYCSMEPFHQQGETHQELLAHGVVIIEGLDLVRIDPGEYELLCLPVKLEAEGSPARVILRDLRRPS